MHSQHVQKVDVIAAVQVHLEQLAAQEQLDKMGADILKTYSAVFVPCPHTDDLPTDVYCCIKVMFMVSNIDNCLGDRLVPRTLGEIALVVIFCVENIWPVTFQTTMVVKE